MENILFSGKSVLSLLETLQDSSYYVYSSNYNRITAKVEDEFNIFNRNKEVDSVTRFKNMNVSDDKLNVSILSVLEGTVKINPIQAKKVGLDSLFNSKIFRNQSIIKNGKLNMDNIVVLVQQDTYDTLIEKGFKDNIEVIEETYEYNNNSYYKLKLNLKGLSILDTVSEELTTKEVLDKVVLRDELIALKKVLTHYLSNFKVDTPDVFLGGGYTEEQIELLKEHGINRDGVYEGVGDKTVIKKEQKFYIAKDFSFSIKGQASIPSVNAVLKKIEADKNLNSIESIIAYQLEKFSEFGGDKEFLEESIQKVDGELNSLKTLLFSVRIYKMLREMGEFENTDIDKKGNMTYSDGENTLIIKINNIKVYN